MSQFSFATNNSNEMCAWIIVTLANKILGLISLLWQLKTNMNKKKKEKEQDIMSDFPNRYLDLIP